MKKFISIISIVTCASLALTSCGGNDSDEKGSAGGSNDKVINVWAMGEEGKLLDEFITDFEQESGYEVNVQAIPWGEAHKKLLTAVASKEGPDVIQLGTSWMTEFADAGALVDISDKVNSYENLQADNFFASSYDTNIFEDGLYGIPFFADTRLLYYRTDILNEVGYDEAPKTWEELKDASEKLAARGDDFYGMNWDANEQSLAYMLANQQGANYTGRTPETNYDTPEFIKAVEYLNSFFEDGEVPIDLNVDVVQGFSNGQYTPMFVSGPWMINIINDVAPEIEGKWATAVLPMGSENNDSILGGTNLTVFEYGQNTDGALEFINYMADTDVQYKWFETSSTLPANSKTWEENATLNEDALIGPFGEQLAKTQVMPLTTSFEKEAQIWLGYFERIYRGNEDVAELVKEFNDEVEGIR